MAGDANGRIYPAAYPVSGSLRLAAGLLGEMIEQARAAMPNEACGVAGGTSGRVEMLCPLTNTAASAERYTVDPYEQMEAYRAIADAGLECVAVYHSHPETPARPSVTDIAEAYDPEVIYLIVSLAEKDPSVCAFEIRDGEVTELTIEHEA